MRNLIALVAGLLVTIGLLVAISAYFYKEGATAVNELQAINTSTATTWAGKIEELGTKGLTVALTIVGFFVIIVLVYIANMFGVFGAA